MKSLTGELSTVPHDAILEHLGKLLSSQSFQGAERSAKLLRFLVEQTVSGQPDRLKEYTLATEALGRGSSFDSRTDTIVRAEVSRLRNRLDRYYASEGQTDSVVITLSKGSYVPRFQKRTIPPGSVRDLEGKRPSLTKNLTWFALGLGVAACVAVFIVWNLWRVPQPDGAISIAVLPFANLSSERSQEFFSDGVTDDIAGALAKIPNLRVVGRSSAFQFKGENKDLRAIGQALGATHLIERSVREIENHVRITAQLIETRNGLQLWSETYDRQLTDIFAIQEDIAQSIAASLRVPLGLAKGDTLVRDRTKDTESYDRYLRARALLRTRGQEPITDAIALLEQVVARDPGFAASRALLAQAYVVMLANSPRDGTDKDARQLTQTSLFKAERAARESVQLDSRNALAYSALARVQVRRGKWAEAEDLHKQALALDPGEPEVLENYGLMLESVGRLREALSIGEKLRTLEPFVPVYATGTARYMLQNGRDAAGIAILEALPPNAAGGLARNTVLAEAYAQQGRFAEAADTLLLTTGNVVPRRAVEDAARLLRNAPTKVVALGSLPVLPSGLDFVYAYVGAPERLLEWNERALEIDYNLGVGALWLPVAAPLRTMERFKAYVRKAGLVDHWRARGWPDLCHPIGADDFVCD